MEVAPLFPFFAFLFGLVIGSFLNVVILRMNTGVGLGGRSNCMSCGHVLEWAELIPVFSYLVLLGRCRVCKSRISAQYPLVELTTAVLFALVVWKFPFDSSGQVLLNLIYFLIMALSVVMAAYDIRHKIIPDSLVYSFAALSFLTVFLSSEFFRIPHLWTLLAGPTLALPFALLWLISKGQWIGFGDAKLALGIGWLLGMNAGLNALILAFWIGAVVGIGWMLYSYGRWKKRLEIPFGPFLIAGTLLVFFLDIEVINFRDVVWLIFGL